MLKIRTTGLEQYAAGGEGRLQIMIIGGGGAGKTRFSSFMPKPIYANCEAGLASIADRNAAFVDVKTSQDMLDLLSYLALECRRPYGDRAYQTVVIDTIDAFQRSIKDEWLRANPGSQSFRGFDAWGYLDAKMQMLLTRLLNLDMNVVVLAHYKAKAIKDDDDSDRQELMLQLSGEVKDSIFNDFDLVGWMGTYWGLQDGKRVEKRGLTFKRTPDKPFLKDRLHVTPEWMEVSFSEDDYAKLFLAVNSRLDEMSPSTELGDIPTAAPGTAPAGGVVSLGGGPLPPRGSAAGPPAEDAPVGLAAFDKVTLQRMARDKGLDFKANTIKAELIAMLEQADAVPVARTGEQQADQPGPAAPAATRPEAAQPDTVQPDPAPASKPAPEPVTATPAPEPAPEPLDAPSTGVQPGDTPIQTEVGAVDTATGEVLAAEPVLSAEQVAQALGGQVVSSSAAPEDKQMAPEPAAPAAPALAPSAAPAAGAPSGACEVCGKDLAGENHNYVKLSWIKFRKHLCGEHFMEAKNAQK